MSSTLQVLAEIQKDDTAFWSASLKDPSVAARGSLGAFPQGGEGLFNHGFLRISTHQSLSLPGMAALICIDMQKDFLEHDSPLCVAGGMACLPKVQEAVEKARKSAVPIFWVIREHDPSGIDIEWTRKHLVAGEDSRGATILGTRGAEMAEGLERRPGEHRVVKTRFSAFFHTPLDLMLRRLAIKSVVLCGVQTPNCIRGTATEAIGLDYEVIVLSDATASKSDQVQENNLEDMRCMGIKTMKTLAWQPTQPEVSDT